MDQFTVGKAEFKPYTNPVVTLNINNPAPGYPTRRLNANVLNALRNGVVAVDGRRTGKTITLLTYLAVVQPKSRLGAGIAPIVVGDTEMYNDRLKRIWNDQFRDYPMPRFVSRRQFIGQDGWSGLVFFEEPRENWDKKRLIEHATYGGGFGGGVSSVPYWESLYHEGRLV